MITSSCRKDSYKFPNIKGELRYSELLNVLLGRKSGQFEPKARYSSVLKERIHYFLNLEYG